MGAFATSVASFRGLSRRGGFMKIAACFLLIAGCFCVAQEVHAKTPAEVFEAVSYSVVVVYGNDSAGNHKSLGSGVVLPKSDVVTNCHVVNEAARLLVKHRNREYLATLKYADHERDVCSLTVPGLTAPPATLGNTNNLKVGQRVYAVGAPRGLELTLSEGLISGFRELKVGRYIQTTAPISPGSSGGGLFDEQGRLIGLPTFFLAEGQQLNFAVPVEWVKELSQRRMAARSAGNSGLEWWRPRVTELIGNKDWHGLLNQSLEWTKSH